MPDHREGDFAHISKCLQGSLADAQPTADGFVVEPFFCFGRQGKRGKRQAKELIETATLAVMR
ncbi:hypothetical protein SAMN02745171_00066 [Porphyromonas circumdentaria]|uniref:Uncharacterized protein n=1 Tax=Porphyromonas circumdentaria TaxID=29524 RepID=A0A1T4KIZ8_9PORP|nr:hypothetical protein [Porphyromonas circumdentaria]SJZ42389.1 hypothetical protein SAMN02745171_00066 [Porphyromonas circumdentaria]